MDGKKKGGKRGVWRRKNEEIRASCENFVECVCVCVCMCVYVCAVSRPVPLQPAAHPDGVGEGFKTIQRRNRIGLFCKRALEKRLANVHSTKKSEPCTARSREDEPRNGRPNTKKLSSLFK